MPTLLRALMLLLTLASLPAAVQEVPDERERNLGATHASSCQSSARDPVAGEVRDPWASLHPRHAIACLAGLREALDHAPDDQHLLGLAIMAYANLSLGGSVDDHGACGPWYAYGLELTARRQKGRDGRPCATLAEAAPELWFQFMRDDMRGVEQALGRWPAERDTPHARALHALATGDWRELDPVARLTPHERYALAWSCQRSRHYESLERVAACDPRINIDAFSLLLWQLPQNAHRPLWVGRVVADAAWMCASTQLDEPVAMRHLQDLAAGFPVTADPAAGRKGLIGAIDQTVAGIPFVPPQAFATAVRIAESLRGPRGGLMDGPRHRLVALPDIAQWMASRLCRAGAAAYDEDSRGERPPGRPLGVLLAQMAPEALVTARLQQCGSGRVILPAKGRSPVERSHEMQKAIRREAARPFPFQEQLLSDTALMAYVFDADAGKRILARLEQLGRSADLDLRGRGVLRQPFLIRQATFTADWFPLWRRVAQADPWDATMWEHVRLLAEDRRLFDCADIAPDAVWSDPVIDRKVEAWSEVTGTRRLLVRWQGTVEAARAGPYSFFFKGQPEMVRCQVGNRALASTRTNAFQGEMMTIDLPAGRHPVVCEIVSRKGRPECRLEWLVPGAKKPVVIPAEAVRHGDGQAGWAVQAWSGAAAWRRAFRLAADERGFLEACAWHAQLMSQAAKWFDRVDDVDEAQAWLDRLETASLWFADRDMAGQAAWIRMRSKDQAVVLEGCRQWLVRSLLTSAMHNRSPITPEEARTRSVGMPVVLSRKQLTGILDAHPEVFLAALAQRGDGAQVARCRGFLALMAGGFAAAREALQEAVGRDDGWGSPRERFIARLEGAALGRMLGRPDPDWAALAREAGPRWSRAVDAIAGRISMEDARDLIADRQLDAVLRYALGLEALIVGDHAEALSLMRTVTDNDGGDDAVVSGRCLGEWIAAQSREVLTALPRVKRTVSAGGADNF